jgi:putative ABC transport system permease protein
MAPGQNALLVLILGLGVGVFVAIRLANRAAISSFANFSETLIGQSDWVIEPPAGSFSVSILPELRAALGAAPVAIIPVLETTAARPLSGNEDYYERDTYTLLGLDLIGIANLRPEAAGRGLAEFPGDRAEVWVPQKLAGFRRLRLVIGDTRTTLPVAGTIAAARDAPPPPATLLVMDLPQVQRLVGKEGKIDRVEFVVLPGPHAAQRRSALGELLARLGEDGQRWNVTTPGARRETAEKMTEAFRLNLTILSLIALLVGLYLILQALDGMVVRRRLEIAILRSLGVEEATLRRLWLLEAAVLGVCGGAIGTLLGWAGAQGAVRAVGRTVNALYYATTVSSARLTGREVALGIVLGLVASLAAGWWPAKEAAQTPPAQILTRAPAPGAGLWRRPWLGFALIGAGLVCVRLPPVPLSSGARFPLAGYAAALAWVVGGGMVFAGLIPALAVLARRLGQAGPAARVAMGHLARPSGRHRLAVASLLCAVGMSAGMAILVSSFERTVRVWITNTLQADLYLTSAGARSASAQTRIPAKTWRELAGRRGVAQAWVLAAYPLQLDKGAPALLTGADLSLMRTRSNPSWVEQPADDAIFDPGRNRRLALVSESFSDRFRKHRGDALTIPTPAGPQAVRIAGVFADYGNERGSIMVPWDSLVSWMHDDAATHVSLFLRRGVNPVAMRAALLRDFPGLEVYTYRSLREDILRIFRQTFTITYALEVIGVVVAVVGLALAMASVLLDRQGELTSLRALGFSRGEMARAAALEGLALAAWAILGGVALSLALGWLLIHVINKQSFGWTLGFAVPGRQLILLSSAVAVTAYAVSYAAGFWGANLPADREE